MFSIKRNQIASYLAEHGCDLCIGHSLVTQKLGRPIPCGEAHVIIEQIILDEGADREDVFKRIKAIEHTVGFRHATGKVVV